MYIFLTVLAMIVGLIYTSCGIAYFSHKEYIGLMDVNIAIS